MILTINSYLFFRPILKLKHKFVLEVSWVFLRQAQSFLRFVYFKKKEESKGKFLHIYHYRIPLYIFF